MMPIIMSIGNIVIESALGGLIEMMIIMTCVLGYFLSSLDFGNFLKRHRGLMLHKHAIACNSNSMVPVL